MAALVDPDAPALAAVASNPAPEGARTGWLSTGDGIRLRYAYWLKSAGPPRGTVCLVHGRTEFIEKYFETIADFRRRGFAVASFDWRGQGGSDRLLGNRLSGYVEHFDDYWTDLTSFHAGVLLPDCPGPYYLVGHSMGGLVALLAAARDRMMFDRIFVTAPMLALDGQPLGMGGMAALAETACVLGLGRLQVRRGADAPPSAGRFPGNPVTSDFGRYMRVVDTWAERPDLMLGAPTLRWVAAAFRAMAAAGRDGFPLSVRTPLLMLAAAHDEVVSTAAIEQLGLRMRTGRHLVIPAARHELFMENDIVRGQVLAAFDAFITEQSH
jgi:lysophospholipase